MKKFDNLLIRLTHKTKMSTTPLTELIIGLSGTDSIVTFIALNEVAKTEGFTVKGIHYIDSPNAPKTLFQREAYPWLIEKYPNSQIIITTPHGGVNDDQYRWGDIHHRALENRSWVVSSTNATEKALGTFCIMANSASITPIITLYKSEVLEVCKEYGVPENVINRSRLPDCICGREEFAASNIELIDEVLRNNLTKDYSADLIKKAMEYIRDTKKANDFKNRTPYNV